MDRLGKLVREAEPYQSERYSQTPGNIAEATGKFKFVSFVIIMGQFNLGGKRWLRKFVRGSPITGELSQSVVRPTDKSVDPAPDLAAIWEDSATRYKSREQGSGWPNAEHLRAEALDQVEKGWLDPHPLFCFQLLSRTT